MLNICMIVPGMPADEDEWFLPYLTDYIHALSQQAKVKVYTLKHPFEDRSYLVRGIRVRAFQRKWLGLQTALLNAVIADHNLESYTHVHAVWANTAGFFGAMVARNLKLPFIVTMGGEELVHLKHIRYGAMRKWRTRPILRYALSTADAVIAPSSGTRNKLLQVWKQPESKLHSIWFGADITRFNPPSAKPPGPLHIVAIGGLLPVKRHSLLLKALPIIRQKVPEAHITIAGEGPLRSKLEALSRDLGIEDAVYLPGWVDHSDMPELYRTAHVAAVTSYHEEIPVALLEALASGLGVVSVNTGIAADLFDNGQFPLRIADPTPEAVAESILALWAERTSHKSSSLSEIARDTLSSDQTVEHMLRVFAALSEKDRTAAR